MPLGQITFQNVLQQSGVGLTPTWGPQAASDLAVRGTPNIFVTSGNQLVGPYSAFDRFVRANPQYRGWEAHHVVERNLLTRMNVAEQFTNYSQNLCVLLPAGGHRGRLNRVLHALDSNDKREVPNPVDVLRQYLQAYRQLGDYSGGGEQAICRELMQLVNATLHLAGVSDSAGVFERYRSLLGDVREALDLSGGESMSDIFQRSLESPPLVGGVLFGAPYAPTPWSCKSIEVEMQDDCATLHFALEKQGQQETAKFVMPKEIWYAAVEILAPSDWMTALTDVSPGECHLFHTSAGSYVDPDEVSCHPAFLTSPLGNCLAEAESEVSRFVQRPDVLSVQWYDVPAFIRPENGRLRVDSPRADGNSLVRLRIHYNKCAQVEHQTAARFTASAFKSGAHCLPDLKAWSRRVQKGKVCTCQQNELSQRALARAQRYSKGFHQVERLAETLAVLRWALKTCTNPECLGERYRNPTPLLTMPRSAAKLSYFYLDDAGESSLRNLNCVCELTEREASLDFWSFISKRPTCRSGQHSRRLGPGTRSMMRYLEGEQEIGFAEFLTQQTIEPANPATIEQQQLLIAREDLGVFHWDHVKTTTRWNAQKELEFARTTAKCAAGSNFFTISRSGGRFQIKNVLNKVVFTAPWNNHTLILLPDNYHCLPLDRKSLANLTKKAKVDFVFAESNGKWKKTSGEITEVESHGDESSSAVQAIKFSIGYPDRELRPDTLVLRGYQVNYLSPWEVRTEAFEVADWSICKVADTEHRSMVSVSWSTQLTQPQDAVMSGSQFEARALPSTPPGSATLETVAEILYTPLQLGDSRLPAGLSELSPELRRELLRETPELDFRSPRLQTYAIGIKSQISKAMRAISLRRLVTALISVTNYISAETKASVIEKQGEGCCRHKATLLCALLRAVDIPAQVKGGLFVSVGSPTGVFHAWVEAHLGNHIYYLDSSINEPGQYITICEESLEGDLQNQTDDLKLVICIKNPNGVRPCLIRLVQDDFQGAKSDDGDPTSDEPLEAYLHEEPRLLQMARCGYCQFGAAVRAVINRNPTAYQAPPADDESLAMEILIGVKELDLFRVLFLERTLDRKPVQFISAQLRGSHERAAFNLGIRVALSQMAPDLIEAIAAIGGELQNQDILNQSFWGSLQRDLNLTGLACATASTAGLQSTKNNWGSICDTESSKALYQLFFNL